MISNVIYVMYTILHHKQDNIQNPLFIEKRHLGCFNIILFKIAEQFLFYDKNITNNREDFKYFFWHIPINFYKYRFIINYSGHTYKISRQVQSVSSWYILKSISDMQKFCNCHTVCMFLWQYIWQDSWNALRCLFLLLLLIIYHL